MAMYDPIVVSSYKYIDPTRGVNGTGTFADPYNTWGTAGWWVPNTGYLQKADTTHPNQITVYNNGPYYLGTYDPLTGNPIRDNTRHAKVRSSVGGQRAVALGTLNPAGRNNISIDNMDLRGPRISTVFSEGVSGTSPTNDAQTNIQIRRCILDGNYAAQISGAGILIEDCVAYGWDSSLVLASSNVRVRRNRCLHIIDAGAPKVAYDPEWDSIVINLAIGALPGELYVEDNYCDGAGTLKQGIHINYMGAGAEPTRGGIVIIRNNRLKHARQAIYSDLSNALIENNRISDVYTVPGFTYLDPNYVAGSSACINLTASNATVRGNVALGNVADGSMFVAAAAAGETIFEHNSGIGVRCGPYFASDGGGAVAATMRNNLIVRAPVLLPVGQTRLTTINSNVTLSASKNHYHWVDGSPTFQANFVDYDMAGWQASVEPTAQSGDPMIDDSGAPQVGSPLILAGAQGVLGGSADIRRTTRWAPPSIGALEYVRARPTRTLP